MEHGIIQVEGTSGGHLEATPLLEHPFQSGIRLLSVSSSHTLHPSKDGISTASGHLCQRLTNPTAKLFSGNLLHG